MNWKQLIFALLQTLINDSLTHLDRNRYLTQWVEAMGEGSLTASNLKFKWLHFTIFFHSPWFYCSIAKRWHKVMKMINTSKIRHPVFLFILQKKTLHPSQRPVWSLSVLVPCEMQMLAKIKLWRSAPAIVLSHTDRCSASCIKLVALCSLLLRCLSLV